MKQKFGGALGTTSPYDFSKTITVKYKAAGVIIQGEG